MNPYMDDNGIFDNQPQHSHMHDFATTATATFVGAAVGASLDNTRFGRWFNTSPVIGWIYKKIFQFIIVGGVFLVGMYLYQLIRIW